MKTIAVFLLRATRRLLKEAEIRLDRLRSGHPLPLSPARRNGRRKEIGNLLDRLQLDAAAAAYLAGHRRRFVETLELVPSGGGTARALELGSYLQMAAVLARVLDYGEVSGAYYSAEPGGQHRKNIAIAGQPAFECAVHLFDAERHRFPFADGSLEFILCCELIEHLVHDPMHLLVECHRILAPRGLLLITTPNASSLSSVAAALHGSRNPQVFSHYPKAGNNDTPHVREYTPKELAGAAEAAGYEVEILVTARMQGCEDEHGWVRELLEREGLDTGLRGEQIYCLARKREGVEVDRYPSFLYAG